MKLVYCIKELCLGCHQCETACAIAHSIGKTLADALTEPVVPRNRITIKNIPRNNKPFPVKCRHCNPAPCIPFCHTGALQRDFATGLVVIDEYRCSGCRECVNACQFSAIAVGMSNLPDNLHPVALKCDGCIERLHSGEEPACVDSCKTGALVYSALDDQLRQKRMEAIDKAKLIL